MKKRVSMIKRLCVISMISFSICGCSSNNKESKVVDTNGVYKESEAKTSEEKVYTLKSDKEIEEGKVNPEVRLNESDKTFSFSYDALSPYLPHGEYSEGEYTDKVYLKTSDGKYEYVFDKVDDGNVLKFDKEHSSSLNIIDENITPSLEDGAEFVNK